MSSKTKKSIEQKPQTSATVAPLDAEDREADVLYQKLGGTVYAFSVVDDEIYFAPINHEALEGNSDHEV